MTLNSNPILHWLVDSGVTEWGADTPAKPLQLRPVTAAVIADAGRRPVVSTAASGTDWQASLAGLTDLPLFNDWLRGFRDLSLCRTATQVVLGQGQINQPLIMVIGEAPDAIEDQNGQAFSGPAHQLIQQALTHLPIPTEQVYLTYLSKWRPPGQRSLSVPEFDLAQAVLQQEIALVQPQHLVVLGDALPRALTRLAESLTVVPETADSELKSPRSKAGQPKIYTVVFKHKNTVSGLSNRVLSLQKPEIMLKDLLTKKRVWQGLLSFCQSLPTSKA